MFSPGQIVYFNEFFFKNGNTSKPKYFIVLANISEQTIVASLPTRTNLAASLITKSHGCINIEERCFNCYAFEANRSIASNGFSFPLPTYLYGDQVEDYEVELLRDLYKIEGVDYEIMGILTAPEFKTIIDCITNSGSIKRKIKRLMSQGK